MKVKEKLEKLISKTFISGIIGLIVMYFKPELASHIVSICLIIAGHHVSKEYCDMKKETK